MAKVEPDRVLKALRSVLPKKESIISLHEPCFSGNEWAYVRECLDTGWVSYVGKFVDRFETMLAEYTGVRRAVAVVNGTSALHIGLLAIGVRRDDEVLLGALTFVATANAVAYCGAIPHFVDSEEKTMGLDPEKLKRYLRETADVRKEGCYNRTTGRRIGAVIAMHTFGHPVDLDPLSEVCREFKLELVEDAAESIGSYYKGRHTGQWGKVSVLSFNGNKTITTGGGGAVLTQDESLADEIKHITTTAKVPHPWAYKHDRVGYNYRLPNINAALGCAQMEELPRFLTNKRSLAERYQRAFEGVGGLRFFTEPGFAKSNYWLNALILDRENVDQLETLLKLTNDQGIMTRPAWTLMHRLEMYKHCPRMDLCVAEDLEKRILNLPSSPALGAAHE
jgi:perosamine synthetase